VLFGDALFAAALLGVALLLAQLLDTVIYCHSSTHVMTL
jgi:hypothetical protein